MTHFFLSLGGSTENTLGWQEDVIRARMGSLELRKVQNLYWEDVWWALVSQWPTALLFLLISVTETWTHLWDRAGVTAPTALRGHWGCCRSHADTIIVNILSKAPSTKSMGRFWLCWKMAQPEIPFRGEKLGGHPSKGDSWDWCRCRMRWSLGLLQELGGGSRGGAKCSVQGWRTALGFPWGWFLSKSWPAPGEVLWVMPGLNETGKTVSNWHCVHASLPQNI